MRDSNRLDKFYDEFKRIHKKYFPDYRFLQLMLDFMGWIVNTKKLDPFFCEEDKCIDLLREYTGTGGGSFFFKGWGVVDGYTPEEMEK